MGPITKVCMNLSWKQIPVVSLKSTFWKVNNSVVCTQFLMGSKFHQSQSEVYFPQFADKF